jgi:hypothetical protein
MRARDFSCLSLLANGLVCSSHVGCSNPPAHAPKANAGVLATKSKAPDPRRQRQSARFGYSWTLPAGWDFVDAGLFWASAPVPAVDVYAAQQSADGPFLLAIVTDVMHIVPGKHPGDDPSDYDDLERDGKKALQQAHVELTSIQRLQTFGVEAVEVNGQQAKLKVSVRLLYVGYRKFEFRCFHLIEQGECGSALRDFLIEELPEPPKEQDVPQVRHLRDARFGVAFDAPSDAWLSIGPHFAAGGTQVVWTWVESGRQIDVEVMDLEGVPNPADQTSLATELASHDRVSGYSVVENQTAFAGRLWDHHEMSGKDKKARDLFILVQQNAMYGVLVTQPTRDPRLIDAAKRGFRLIPRSSPAHRDTP